MPVHSNPVPVGLRWGYNRVEALTLRSNYLTPEGVTRAVDHDASGFRRPREPAELTEWMPGVVRIGWRSRVPGEGRRPKEGSFGTAKAGQGVTKDDSFLTSKAGRPMAQMSI